MLGSNRLHGFLKKYNLVGAIYNVHVLLGVSKISTRGLTSLQRSRPRTRFRQLCKKGKKPNTPYPKNDTDFKVYMRDTISNISNILRYSTWDSAEEQLSKLSVKWDSFTVNQVLKTHPPMEKAWLFFNWASGLKGFKHDQFTYTTMMDIFGEAGRISSMNFVFQQMQEKAIKVDVVTYTSRLHWLSNAGDIDGSIESWNEMKAKGLSPTVVSYTAFMKVLFGNGREKEATDVYKEMIECGCPPNCHTYTVLMDYLANSGKYKAVLDIFRKMQEAGEQPDKATCNILIEKCCESRETWAMTQILQYMKANAVVLRYNVYLQALAALKAAGESDFLLRQVNRHFSHERSREEDKVMFSDSTADRQLVKDLLMKKKFVASDYFLTEAGNKNITLGPAIISDIIMLNCAHGRPYGAVLGYEYSMKMGITIRRTEFLALVGVFIRENVFPKVVEIVEDMVRREITLGVYLGTILIYKLGCARLPTSAAKIFKLLPDDQKCAPTYSALIWAYFLDGSVDNGLKIFETMQEKGIVPALGTYNVLLAGLEKCGRVGEAETFRKEKKNLQSSFRFRDDVPVEERICNLLFTGDFVFSLSR